MQATISSNENENRLVSVIIPTYNRSDLLAEAVNSVYTQSYRPIECIVVDDGSTDDTADMIQKLKNLNSEDFQLIYIVQENAGSQAARNKGTAAATGEYIQYLDSDDLLYKTKLKIQVTYLEQNPACDAVFGDWEKGKKDNAKLVQGYASNDMIFQLLGQQPIHTLSILFRRELVKRIGNWDVAIKRNQEIDFHLRGLLLEAVYHYHPGVTGLWRTHEGERIGNSTEFTSAIHFYQKWEKLLRDKNMWSAKISEGISDNYIWFLNEYPDSSSNELQKLLFEMKRLNPKHPIFNSKKYKIIRLFAGTRMANSAWIKVYKRKANV